MNRRHFAWITNWLRRRPLPRSPSALIISAILVSAAGVAWHKIHTICHPYAVQATFADSPAWEAVRPDGSVYLPGGSDQGRATTVITPVAMPTPVDECGPPPASASMPSVAAGPEIFGAAAGAAPGSAAASRPQPAMGPVVAAGTCVPNVAGTKVGPVPPPQLFRSDAMEMIARQADEKIRDGIDLADRGAYFAARADFIAALRLLAQGLDNDEGSTRHSRSLGAALTAMKEAQDFLPVSGKVEGDLDLPPIVAGHRTPLLKNVPPERLQAMRAMKQYFSYAQEQLCAAACHEVSGSMALRSLGKLHAAMADKSAAEIALPEAKAITFYQAAILVCPRNYMAANDLGVLLAHKNGYAAARGALEHSVRICPCAENLGNLSIVYRQLGDLRSAELAGRNAEAAKAAELARQKSNNRFLGGAVQWVDPSVMAKPIGEWTDLPVRSAASTSAAQGPAAGAAPGQATAPTASPIIR